MLGRLPEKFGWAFPTDFRSREHDADGVDTQDLTRRASALMDADPTRTLFSTLVIMDMEAGHISPAQAEQYIAMAEHESHAERI